MAECCPFADGLQCSQAERVDEFYLQMQDAMLGNKPVYFVTGGRCPAYSLNCMKLYEYEQKMQKQR